MRMCGRQPEWIKFHNRMVGINLPADFTAEHEWGIDRLKQLFGIPRYAPEEGVCGIERRKATKVPLMQGQDTLVYNERSDYKTHLIVGWESPRIAIPDDLEHAYTSSLKWDKDKTLFGAWDEGSFGIVSKLKDNTKHMKELKEAIEQTNVLVFLGGGQFLENNGLNIVIADRVPKEQRKIMKEGDEKIQELYKLCAATGIKEKLEQAHKRYFALSPRWLNGQKSKYKVGFWLNPMEQSRYSMGLYTVEELEQWIEDKGPVLKNSRCDAV